MSRVRYTLVGHSLDSSSLAKIPSDLQFSLKDLAKIPFEEVAETKLPFDPLDFRAAHLLSTTEYRCPSCLPDAPPVTVQVLAACGLGSAAQVAIQCSFGHWASYPCR
jgi:hypothetical protein